MWEIWANSLLSNALKSCPKSNKLPNLVTLMLMLFDRSNKDDDKKDKTEIFFF